MCPHRSQNNIGVVGADLYSIYICMMMSCTHRLLPSNPNITYMQANLLDESVRSDPLFSRFYRCTPEYIYPICLFPPLSFFFFFFSPFPVPSQNESNESARIRLQQKSTRPNSTRPTPNPILWLQGVCIGSHTLYPQVGLPRARAWPVENPP